MDDNCAIPCVTRAIHKMHAIVRHGICCIETAAFLNAQKIPIMLLREAVDPIVDAVHRNFIYIPAASPEILATNSLLAWAPSIII